MPFVGYGKQTFHPRGKTKPYVCPNCRTSNRFVLNVRRTWLTLNGFPTIPYQTHYVAMCPHCGSDAHLPKSDFSATVFTGETDVLVPKPGSLAAGPDPNSVEIKCPACMRESRAVPKEDGTVTCRLCAVTFMLRTAEQAASPNP